MNPLVRDLFHELADMPFEDREKILKERHIAPEVRCEVESLLSFDSENDQSAIENAPETFRHVMFGREERGLATWGPYHGIRLIGSGGMGSVYLAERTDGEIQQKVAVKLLHSDNSRPARLGRFLKERQLLAYLNHSSIARLLDAGHTPQGRPYLVMEYVEGVPIDIYAEKLDLRHQFELFLRVFEGVSHAHARLIIHRDLKPSNILVDASGQPKLLDFGIAKLLDRPAEPTVTVERMLTPNYASPEQFLGKAETTASDVYSLGAVLYKVVTGRSPHESESGTVMPIEQIVQTHEIAPPRRLRPSLPGDVDYILSKALRKEPEERYPSVEAFANDIRAFLESRPVEARSGDAWYRARRFLRRYWIPVTATLLLIVVLSSGLYEINRQRTVAQRRFQQVRQLANKVLALDETIRLLPGSTQARYEIVAMSKEYLEGLEAEARRDPDLALEVGIAYGSLARAQGVPTTANLGQYDEAEKSLSKAEALIDSTIAASPQNAKALFASADIDQGRMILAYDRPDRDMALKYALKAASRSEALLALGEGSPSELRETARILSNVALLHKNLHLYQDSIRYARRALDVAQSQAADQPAAANALSIMADSLRYSGDLDGALKAIEQARAIAEKADFAPGKSRATLLFNILWRQGMVLGADGQISLERPDEAVAVFQKALDVIENLSRQDVHDASSRMLYPQAARELGSILAHKNPARALSIYDQALLRLAEVKNNSTARRSEAELLALSSYSFRRLNRIREAKERIDKAFGLLREIKAYPTDRISTMDEEVQYVLRAWGAHLAETGEPQRAAEVYQELLDKILPSHPDPNNDIRDAVPLSLIYGPLSNLYARTGDAARANDMSAQRLEIWENWSRKLPQNNFIRHQLEAAQK
jgi:serine/threonine protein kinase